MLSFRCEDTKNAPIFNYFRSKVLILFKLLLCIRGGGPLAVEEYFFLLPAFSGRHIGLPLHCGWLLFAVGAHRRAHLFSCFCLSVLLSFCSFVFKPSPLCLVTRI